MTALKTMLVPVGTATSSVALDMALRMAGEFSAHVTGLHVRTDTTIVPPSGEGMTTGFIKDLQSHASRQNQERATQARNVFDAALKRMGIRLADHPAEGLPLAQWIDVAGSIDTEVGRRGRVHDLTVVTPQGKTASIEGSPVLSAALMESGKPLLLVPGNNTSTTGQRIGIAWNGSIEAGRAVAFAMPFLLRAQAVTVFTIQEGDKSPSGVSAADLVKTLAWSGITATHEESQVTHAGYTGLQLLDGCRGMRADMLVMGAYTHSRLRQFIFGGTTRYMIENSDIPCLMCH